MFDPFLRAVAWVLSALYGLPMVGGSYGVAIILLTFAVMVLLMPLTLRATRSTIRMQAVQPEMKRIQKKYKGKDDREALNKELMGLYQENGINPVGGCLPVLAQAPVFLVLFQVLRGLTRRISDSPFYEAANSVLGKQGLETAAGNEINPRFLAQDSVLYQDLFGETEMRFGPFDLALQPWDVLQDSVLKGIPYVVLIIFVVATSYYQQRQVSARRGNDPSPINPQQQMLLRVLPLLSGFWSFIFPAGLVLYWATSNAFRIGQQSYITRQIYGREADQKKNSPPAGKAGKAGSGKDDSSAGKASGKGGGGNGAKGANKNGAKGGGKSGTPAKSAKSASNGSGDTGSGSGKKPSKSSGKGSGAKDGSSKRKTGARAKDAEWRKLRQQKQAQTKGSLSTSSRVTPKGTQAKPQKKKRKR